MAVGPSPLFGVCHSAITTVATSVTLLLAMILDTLFYLVVLMSGKSFTSHRASVTEQQ